MGKRDVFRFAEKCLYEYPENHARLEALREALSDLRSSASVQGQGYEPIGHGGGGDPVASRAQKIADLEREIFKLERVTSPIVRLHKNLNSEFVLANSLRGDLSKILNLCYFGGNNNAQVAEILSISERTVYKLRCRLVGMAIQCLGL